MIQPWKKIGSDTGVDFRIFKVRTEQKISPRTGDQHSVFVIDSVNWVNVIAVTPNDELVMIEQYRHGSDAIELEIPGGMIDAGDVSPAAAGIRELREETGYEGEHPRIIGAIRPNPAIMSNTCYTLMVDNCRLKHPVEFDHGEDVITRLVPVAELRKMVASGEIQHSLVVVALYHFDLLRQGLKPA